MSSFQWYTCYLGKVAREKRYTTLKTLLCSEISQNQQVLGPKIRVKIFKNCKTNQLVCVKNISKYHYKSSKLKQSILPNECILWLHSSLCFAPLVPTPLHYASRYARFVTFLKWQLLTILRDFMKNAIKLLSNIRISFRV